MEILPLDVQNVFCVIRLTESVDSGCALVYRKLLDLLRNILKKNAKIT
jgi:hypothetical protein